MSSPDNRKAKRALDDAARGIRSDLIWGWPLGRLFTLFRDFGTPSGDPIYGDPDDALPPQFKGAEQIAPREDERKTERKDGSHR